MKQIQLKWFNWLLHLFLISFLCFTSMHARDIQIILPDDTFTIHHYSEVALIERLKSGDFQRVDKVDVSHSITRSYKNEKNEYLLEFYFGGAIKIAEKNLPKIKRVLFLQLYVWLYGDEITYSVILTKDEFEKMSESMSSYSFGSNYVGDYVEQSYINSQGNLLVCWDDRPSPFTGYEFYEGLQTIMAFDPEIAEELDSQLNIEKLDSPYIPLYQKEIASFYPKLADGKQVNAKEAILVMSKVLNIDLEVFDYSVKSLGIIDTSISFNRNRVGSDDIYYPLISYIGEIVKNQHKCKWEIRGKEYDEKLWLVGADKQELNIEEEARVYLFAYGVLGFTSEVYYMINEAMSRK